MTQQYSARIYVDEKVVMHASGDDVEKLHIWMLAQIHSTSGSIRGEVIHKATKEVVCRFKKTAIE